MILRRVQDERGLEAELDRREMPCQRPPQGLTLCGDYPPAHDARSSSSDARLLDEEF